MMEGIAIIASFCHRTGFLITSKAFRTKFPRAWPFVEPPSSAPHSELLLSCVVASIHIPVCSREPSQLTPPAPATCFPVQRPSGQTMVASDRLAVLWAPPPQAPVEQSLLGWLPVGLATGPLHMMGHAWRIWNWIFPTTLIPNNPDAQHPDAAKPNRALAGLVLGRVTLQGAKHPTLAGMPILLSPWIMLCLCLAYLPPNTLQDLAENESPI